MFTPTAWAYVYLLKIKTANAAKTRDLLIRTMDQDDLDDVFDYLVRKGVFGEIVA